MSYDSSKIIEANHENYFMSVPKITQVVPK